uniref:Uncharacterized protein n=1 Tax=Cyphia dentariifolia TaxID=2041117 RepID=A0A291F3W3_9ASTR|nr:hypothetical protein Cyp_den1Pt0175 [Cyphia dentariifolia]ATG26791.1 hypothetical protein Cyp_den1Pt0175 [Cyphia dentariifolia]
MDNAQYYFLDDEPDDNRSPFNSDTILSCLYLLLQPLGEEELEEELKERFLPTDIQRFEAVLRTKNWLFEEKVFLKELRPFIKQFLKDEVYDFYDSGDFVWKLGKLLDERTALQKEEAEVVFLSEELNSSLQDADFLETIGISPTESSFLPIAKDLATLVSKRLATIESKLRDNEKQLDQCQVNLEWVIFMYIIIRELQKDGRNLTPEDDNRFFFLVFYIVFFYLDKMYIYPNRKYLSHKS